MSSLLGVEGAGEGRWAVESPLALYRPPDAILATSWPHARIIHGEQRPDQITRTVQRFHHATTNTNSPDMQDRRGNSRGRPDAWLRPLTPIDNDIFLGGMDHLWTLASIISRTSYQRAS